MSRRKQYRSGAPWEALAGYSRAVRVGQHVFVSGTAPVDDAGEVFAAGDVHAQSRRCIEIIERALQELGGSLVDVVRTRLFVVDIDRWEEVARAHQEAFGEVMPATSMVEVSRLIHPDMLVEIEADAVIASQASDDEIDHA